MYISFFDYWCHNSNVFVQGIRGNDQYQLIGKKRAPSWQTLETVLWLSYEILHGFNVLASW